MAVQYFPAAGADIKEALKWSARNFGDAAAKPYKTLIAAAIREIALNPDLEHSRAAVRLERDIRIYHLKHSRTRAAVEGQIVKRPRHFIAYQVAGNETMILRVLHDRMEIVRQLDDTI